MDRDGARAQGLRPAQVAAPDLGHGPQAGGHSDGDGIAGVGVAHVGGDNGLAFSTSNNSFAMAIGAGVDFKVSHRFSVRPLQVDYLMTRFNELGLGAQSQDNLRVSTGVVLHF